MKSMTYYNTLDAWPADSWSQLLDKYVETSAD